MRSRYYDPIVTLYTAPGGVPIAILPPDCGWGHCTRRNGGFWQATATLRGETRPLCDAFQNWLGRHVEERSAGLVAWEGMVYELELAIGADRRRRSLDLMYNATMATYNDGGVSADTAYATEAVSITRYGRREERLLLDDYPLATAQAYRDTFLSEHAWPWPRPQAMGGPGEAALTVTACGYIYTAQWMFVEEGDGTDDDLDDWLGEIVGTATGLSANHGGAVAGAGDCQFLKAGALTTNTLQTAKATASPARAWDVMQEIAGLGDASGNVWSIRGDLGQVVHYGLVDLAPRYFMRGGVLYDSPGGLNAVNPWAVRPAVVRNLDWPMRTAELGSMLTDARDSLIEEVAVEADGTLRLRPASALESDVLAAQYAEYEPPEEMP